MLRAKLIAAQMAKVKLPGVAGAAGSAAEEIKNHFADEFDINDYPVQVMGCVSAAIAAAATASTLFLLLFFCICTCFCFFPLLLLSFSEVR